MRFRLLSVFCLSALVTSLVGMPVFAAAIYSDRALFLAAVPGATNYDFEVGSGFPSAPGSLASFAGGVVTLNTDDGDAAASLSDYGSGFGQAIGGQVGGAVDNFAALRLTFSPPRFAVGFDDLDLTGVDGSPDEFAIINVTYANAAPAEQFSVSDGDGDFATAAFFGIVSADPIENIQVFSADAIGGLPGSRANLIDNVVLIVPEPASIMLISGGLLLATIGTLRRRPV